MHRTEIDFRKERTVEAVLPSLQGRQYRQVLGFQRVHAGLENVRDPALVHKYRSLAFPDS
jgi:hypothetical protein